MIFKKLTCSFNNKKFVIDEDLPEIGAYLYVYENDKCVYDWLQDSIEICKDLAFEDFGVPKEIWKEEGQNQ